ncbi:MAG: DUF6089 family protein [Bacteroidales bacterium]
MRTAAIILMLIIYPLRSFSTDDLDIGIFAGTSYYIGDINTSLHFYSPSPAFGAMVKYNIDAHYSVRANLNYGKIRGDDLDFGNVLHQTRQAAFVNNFYDFSFQGEFNFKPFKVTIFDRPFTTYITAGLAYTFIPQSGLPAANYLNLPFGGGIKYGLSRKVTLGMEWILKKSFSDDLDGVKSFGQFNSPSLVHNNDWVSLAGFFITIKPFERKGDCPAYWN